MSDYKDKRTVKVPQPEVPNVDTTKDTTLPIPSPFHLGNGLPYIYPDPPAKISGSALTMPNPLSEVYPEAWVAVSGAWAFVRFSTESHGEICAEVFNGTY